MEPRYKHLASQLGKNISHIGQHMPHAAVGIIRKRRRKKTNLNMFREGGSHVHPMKENNPFPLEFTN